MAIIVIAAKVSVKTIITMPVLYCRCHAKMLHGDFWGIGMRICDNFCQHFLTIFGMGENIWRRCLGYWRFSVLTFFGMGIDVFWQNLTWPMGVGAKVAQD